jgi:hypothetical protein
VGKIDSLLDIREEIWRVLDFVEDHGCGAVGKETAGVGHDGSLKVGGFEGGVGGLLTEGLLAGAAKKA